MEMAGITTAKYIVLSWRGARLIRKILLRTQIKARGKMQGMSQLVAYLFQTFITFVEIKSKYPRKYLGSAYVLSDMFQSRLLDLWGRNLMHSCCYHKAFSFPSCYKVY